VGHPNEIEKIAINYDEKIIASADNKRVVLWNFVNGKIVRSIPFTKRNCFISSLSFSNKQGQLMVSFSYYGFEKNDEVEIYSTNSGQLLFKLQNKEGNIRKAMFNADGTLILTYSSTSYGNNDENIDCFKVWDAKTGQLLKSHLFTDRVLKSARFNFDGKKIITLEQSKNKNDYYVCIYDREDDVKLNEFYSGYTANDVYICKNDSKYFIIQNSDLSLFDAKTGSKLRTFLPKKNSEDYSQSISDFSVTLDESKIAIAYGWDKKIIEFDFQSGKILNEISLNGYVENISYLNNNSIFEGVFNSIRLWDLNSKTVIQELKSEISTIKNHQISKDGSKFLQTYDDGTLECWKLQNGEQLNKFLIPNGKIINAVFNQSATEILAVTNDNGIKIYNLKSNKEISNLKIDNNIIYADFLENESKIIVCTKKDVLVYKIKSDNNEIQINFEDSFCVEINYEISSISMSPVKNIIAIVCNHLDVKDGFTTLFLDLKKMKEIKFQDNPKFDSGVNFSNDGQFITNNDCCAPLIYNVNSMSKVIFNDQINFESFGGVFSTDNTKFAVIGDGLDITSLVDKNKKVKSINWNNSDESEYNNNRVDELYFLDNNNKLLIRGNEKIVVFDLVQNKILHEIGSIEFATNKIEVTPNEEYAVFFNSDKNVTLWNLKTGKVEFSRYSFHNNQWFLFDKNIELKGSSEGVNKLMNYYKL
jgi:hypothetical protein